MQAHAHSDYHSCQSLPAFHIARLEVGCVDIAGVTRVSLEWPGGDGMAWMGWYAARQLAGLIGIRTRQLGEYSSHALSAMFQDRVRRVQGDIGNRNAYKWLRPLVSDLPQGTQLRSLNQVHFLRIWDIEVLQMLKPYTESLDVWRMTRGEIEMQLWFTSRWMRKKWGQHTLTPGMLVRASEVGFRHLYFQRFVLVDDTPIFWTADPAVKRMQTIAMSEASFKLFQRETIGALEFLREQVSLDAEVDRLKYGAQRVVGSYKQLNQNPMGNDLRTYYDTIGVFRSAEKMGVVTPLALARANWDLHHDGPSQDEALWLQINIGGLFDPPGSTKRRRMDRGRPGRPT